VNARRRCHSGQAFNDSIWNLMTIRFCVSVAAPSGRSPRRWALAVALAASLFTTSVLAQAPAATTSGAAVAGSPEALEKLVDRIALYPDDLVGIILPASTNPLQVVQADRYLEKRKADPKLAVDEKWDDAVKSLLNYPEIVKIMSSDLDWTTALGEAVVADQGEVLQAVQAFRRKVQAAGNLKTDTKQVVVVEKEVIKIVPANPQVIYVPQYSPTTVVVYGGYSYWGYYPSPYPVYYYPYPPGAAFATGLIWGAAISSSWRGNHYVAHYGGSATININRNTNINTGNINTGNVNRGGNSTSQWKSNKQPGQVSGGVGTKAPSRVGDSRAGSSGFDPGAARPSAAARPAASTGSRTGGSGSGAFDGYGSGRQTQLDSSRGAGSRSSMSGSGARGSSSGGSGGARRR
jgi:hypothetical protein